MLTSGINAARQRAAIGRSAAGVPRTYRILRQKLWSMRMASHIHSWIVREISFRNR
jgi:hypothetical protein